MSKAKKDTIEAKGFAIQIYTEDFKNDYISLTDIAFEFASWISAEFKMYVIQDYKRLKSDENSKLSLGWNLNREISKINYKIHTDAIKEYLLKDLTICTFKDILNYNRMTTIGGV